jgi:hypothetical protein
MTERAKNSENRRDMLKGFGQSVIMQGGFLLLFDTVLYLGLHQQEKELAGLLSSIRFTGSGIALTIR